jgi:hypothetical protein
MAKLGKYGSFIMGAMPKSHPLRPEEIPEHLQGRFNVGRPPEMLDEYIVFAFAYRGDVYIITIKKGFICDFSSIPYMFKRKGETKAPGAVHDALCQCMERVSLGEHPMTWALADLIYYYCLRANKARPVWKSIVYWAVLRVKGWLPSRVPRDINPENIITIVKA